MSKICHRTFHIGHFTQTNGGRLFYFVELTLLFLVHPVNIHPESAIPTNITDLSFSI